MRAYTVAELDAIAAELSPQHRPLPAFAAATGLRPEEWQALERRDVDRGAGLLNVRRTVSSGEVVELGKTARSRRQVPLSPRALDALDALPPRLDTPLLFPAAGAACSTSTTSGAASGHRRSRRPASRSRRASTTCARRSPRNALAAGVSVFELARIMGTSVAMIERHYGTLIEGAGADIARRLGAFDADQGAADERVEGV